MAPKKTRRVQKSRTNIFGATSHFFPFLLEYEPPFHVEESNGLVHPYDHLFNLQPLFSNCSHPKATNELSYTFIPLLKAEDVAEILNISRSMLYRLVKRGELPSIHIRSSVRVRPQDLEKYIEKDTCE
jgi:excisionase family DNA binding protein